MRLAQSLEANLDGYTPLEPEAPSKSALPVTDLQPTFNAMIRCPLPYIGATPDALRQFYMGGRVPQSRILAVK